MSSACMPINSTHPLQADPIIIRGGSKNECSQIQHFPPFLNTKNKQSNMTEAFKITILGGLQWSHDNRYHPKFSSPTLIILSPQPSPIQQKCFLCCVWQLSRRTTEPEYWLPSFVGSSSSVGSCGLHQVCCISSSPSAAPRTHIPPGGSRQDLLAPEVDSFPPGTFRLLAGVLLVLCR